MKDVSPAALTGEESLFGDVGSGVEFLLLVIVNAESILDVMAWCKGNLLMFRWLS